jgi:hypothetical protein
VRSILIGGPFVGKITLDGTRGRLALPSAYQLAHSHVVTEAVRRTG